MMFLLKSAFWLGLLLVLLPSGSKKQTDNMPQINAVQAATAAGGVFADLSQFCTRRPETCAVGSQVASVLAQRAQDGAIMVYQFIAERRQAAPEKIEVLPAHNDTAAVDRTIDDTTGSIGAATPTVMIPRPRPSRMQDTLTASDRQPPWREPAAHREG